MNTDSQMSEKKPKKGTISEEDVSIILQRYTAATVLALLQEVAEIQDAKIDWNALVKRTKTGIKHPREYQMLWRHLAYRDELVEKLEDESKPLDDDSDLEYELEAFPAVNNEASTDAAACVKVLIASGSTCSRSSCSGLDKGLTIEAPLTINIPSGNLPEGTNITVPVCVQKQSVPAAAVVASSATTTEDVAPRRKRKPWSAAEDMELFAAVQKCGEGNWANILKGDFKGDRTASQLSQRWNIIKKRNTTVKTTGSQLSEVHLAARRAINMALDQPGIDNLKASSSSLGRTKSSISTMRSTTIAADEDPTKTFRPKTSLVNGPDPVKAAAVAAGARIATQSAAAAILKQQLKSASIHIKTNVTSFRELHSPRTHDHNPNISAAISPKRDQAAVSAKVEEEKEVVKENAPVEPPVIKDK